MDSYIEEYKPTLLELRQRIDSLKKYVSELAQKEKVDISISIYTEKKESFHFSSLEVKSVIKIED